MRLPLIALLFGVIACDRSLPPVGQVLLVLDTDAPLAPAASFDDPAPLFDRILVEIYPPGERAACAECRRELVADAEMMRERKLSFGFVPRPRVVGYRARLVLYRSSGGLGPRPSSSVELVGYLPAVAEEGVTTITARFATADVGRPRGTLESPILFDRGAPDASAVGTFGKARPTRCERPAPEGAACIPGGAFFMGDPRVTVEGEAGGAKEHLALMPPYYLDRTEVTIGRLRSSGLVSLDSRGRAHDPTDDSDDPLGRCDYTSAVGPNDPLPVNCVSAELAARYCQARGGALPSEAELEMVATRRGAGLSPWGDRDLGCAEISLDGGGCRDADADPFSLGTRTLPAPSGSHPLDRVAVPGGVVVDLAGNLAEWTRDVFQRDDQPCWESPVLSAPICGGDLRAPRSVKGASTYAPSRDAADPESKSPHIGFRCAYPG